MYAMNQPSGVVYRAPRRKSDRSMLCSTCKRVGDWFVSSWLESASFGDNHFQAFAHQPSWKALERSASDGCPFCLRLALVAEDRFARGSIALRERDGKGTAFTITGGTDGRIHVNTGMPWAKFEVYVLPGDAMANRSTALKTQNHSLLDPALESTYRNGREWLEECLMAHTECSSSSRSYVPTRLIDVGPPDGSIDPMLVETADGLLSGGGLCDAYLKYATLSHCWGQTEHLTTTLSTINDRKVSIPFSSLNQTFKDACKVTRAFELRYLWIDSLCIIQDSLRDWEQESSRMGFVYGNSFLNIAADAADDGDQGFLPAKEPIGLPYRIKVSGQAEFQGQLWLRPLSFKRFLSYSGNLRRRGWVLQEYVLSPRSLRYGLYGVTWECRQHSRYDDDVMHDENPMRRAARELKTFPCLLKGSDVKMPEVMNIWHRMVQEYSKKGLTRETDRLPAISGLAASIHHATQERYLAGMWACDLPAALQWIPEGALWRTAHYLAPSWSWASSHKDCIIIYPETSVAFRVQILDVKVTPLGRDPFGRVSGGYIRLEGLLQKASFKVDDPSPVTVDILFGPDQALVCSCPREYVDVEKSPQIWCLLLGGALPETEESLQELKLKSALVLEEVEGNQSVFRRLSIRTGTWSTDYDWKGAERKTITII